MMKHISHTAQTVHHALLVPVLLILLPLTLSAKDTTPVWVTDCKAAFPDDAYLAQRGSGKNAEAARSDALMQLSTYINTSVEANLTTSIANSVTDGKISERTDVSSIISLSSSVSDLFGLQFTEPFYVKKSKTWYAVAYIDRAEAFTRYQPELEDARSAFTASYDLARNEADPLTRCWYMTQSWEEGKAFLAALEYADLIFPAQAKKYKADRQLVTGMKADISASLKSATYLLEVEGDYGDIMTTAVSNILQSVGLQEVRMHPVYTVQVQINDNASSGSKTISITPAVTVSFINTQTGAVSYRYSYKATEKETAYAIETAYKRCFPQLAEDLKSALPADFDANFRL